MSDEYIGRINLKAFFIRILQVVWIISVLAIAINTSIAIAHPRDAKDVLIASFAWTAFLIVVQYLVFASINPSWLFGKNKGRYFSIFIIISIALSITGGVGIKVYNKHEYNKRLEAGTDTVLFDGILSDTIGKYNLTECRDIDSLPAASKEDLKAAASRLEDQKIKGLNILVKIAEQDDAVGRRFRCLIDDDVDAEGLAQIADIDY